MRGFSDSDRSQPLTTYKVNGQDIQIFVDTEGQFYADHNDRRIKAPTMDRMRQKLRDAGREAVIKIEVKALRLSSGRLGPAALREVLLTGIHSRSRDVLYRDVQTGRADHERSYSAQFFRPMTGEEQKQLLAAYAEAEAAEKKRDRLVDRFKIDARTAIEDAIEKAKRELPAEEPEATGDPRVDVPAKKRR